MKKPHKEIELQKKDEEERTPAKPSKSNRTGFIVANQGQPGKSYADVLAKHRKEVNKIERRPCQGNAKRRRPINAIQVVTERVSPQK